MNNGQGNFIISCVITELSKGRNLNNVEPQKQTVRHVFAKLTNVIWPIGL